MEGGYGSEIHRFKGEIRTVSSIEVPPGPLGNFRIHCAIGLCRQVFVLTRGTDSVGNATRRETTENDRNSGPLALPRYLLSDVLPHLTTPAPNSNAVNKNEVWSDVVPSPNCYHNFVCCGVVKLLCRRGLPAKGRALLCSLQHSDVVRLCIGVVPLLSCRCRHTRNMFRLR